MSPKIQYSKSSFGPATALFLILIATNSTFSSAGHPNVLMILVDDLKPTLGCYGDQAAKTPNLDALAERGMRFDAAYCNQAVCAPSRFTLMLGSHSTSTGLYGLGSRLRQNIPDAMTLPQYFAKHGGYRTESLGKVFHVGHGNQGDPESFSVPHFKDKVIEYVDPASTPGGQLTREEAYFTNQQLGDINSLPRGAAFESPDVPDDAYADGRVANETVNRLASAKARRDAKGTPFFIVAGFARPHLPFSAPKKYWDLYDPTELPMPKFEELPQDAPAVAGKRGGEIRNYFPVPDKKDPAQISAKLKRELIHGYYASTSFVDAQIGKVVDALDELDLTDDTIVVLWGDHGFHLGDLGIWTKHTNYEQANRIPILINAPGVTNPGSSTGQLTGSVDVFPTLVELAGLPDPNDLGSRVAQPIDGVSLVPVLRNSEKRVRDHTYHAFPKRKLGRAIRTNRYRLVQWKKPGEDESTAQYELYDYQTDPLESKNLAKRRPKITNELKLILNQYPEAVSKSGNPVTSTDNKTPTTAIETPWIKNRSITISGKVTRRGNNGVLVAQGGRVHGYSAHLVNGRIAFDFRVDEAVTRIIASEAAPQSFSFKATATPSRLTLFVNNEQVATGSSPGLIPEQPTDGLDVGMDERTAAGDYTIPNRLDGDVTHLRVETNEGFAVAQ